MTINLKVEEHIYKLFPIFNIYLEVHCQNYQNNPLSMDPHSIMFVSFELEFMDHGVHLFPCGKSTLFCETRWYIGFR
jgi:hypothetical protein